MKVVQERIFGNSAASIRSVHQIRINRQDHIIERVCDTNRSEDWHTKTQKKSSASRMAQKSLLFLLVGTAFLVGTSFESPIIDCGHLSDRQASPAERIQEFIECLKQEGHDEELLTELKKSYETGNNAQRSSSTSSSNCSPETGFDEKGRFPYCSGMSDLQCRTLTLVLESLLSVPATANAMGIGSSSTEKLLRETLQPIIPRDSSEDENNI